MITNRFDAIDIDEFKRMMASPSFETVQTRISQELTRNIETCTRSDSEIELYRAQGAAAALRTVLDLPKRLLIEMSKPQPPRA